MTLEHWSRVYNVSTYQYGKSSMVKQVFEDDIPKDNHAKYDLFHLDDFVVSSTASGPSIILCMKS